MKVLLLTDFDLQKKSGWHNYVRKIPCTKLCRRDKFYNLMIIYNLSEQISLKKHNIVLKLTFVSKINWSDIKCDKWKNVDTKNDTGIRINP